jgi:hypothetical protein
MRVTVSNVVGAWAAHYAVMTLDGFARTVDRAGGISVDLPDIFIGDQAIGPGVTHTAARRHKPCSGSVGRRRAVAAVAGVPRRPAPMQPSDVTETDDMATVTAQLGAPPGRRPSPCRPRTWADGRDRCRAGARWRSACSGRPCGPP